MNSELSGDQVIVKDGNIAKIHEKSHYGNMTEEGLQLSLIEALYLMEKGKLDVNIDCEDISIEKLIKIIRDQGSLPTILFLGTSVTEVTLLRLVSSTVQNSDYMKGVNLLERVIQTT